MPYRLTVDTGGTFTDVVVADELGNLTVGKSLTTPLRVFDGMSASMRNAAHQLGIDLPELLESTSVFMYGTTHATNALVQKKAAKTALLVTQGFPDTLVIKEGGKSDAHDFSAEYPEPYIPRRHTFEIPERVSSEGEVFLPLDRDQARLVLEEIKKRRFEAIAVSFLWSIANPVNELEVAELIEEMLPGVAYTLSHKLVSIIREYRRTSASAIDASLKPLMQRHLAEMEQDLRSAGYSGDVLVSTSMGGCMHVEELVARPIHTVKSGPAMAPVAGRTYARSENVGRDVIVCDTGGTTFDVGLVRDESIKFTRETWLGGQWTGHILGISSVDVRSVGAGGGSIAWIDSGGLLRVGPHSAGADPGPACYGKGGKAPTTTDAALILGYLDPDFFLGGRMALDVAAAEQAVDGLANQLRRSREETAFGIMSLANELMIKAIQNITISEGINPRECALIAGGGAAGLGIGHIARELGSTHVVLPKTAGALSACGMQYSDIVSEHTASRVARSDEFELDEINAVLDEIEREIYSFSLSLDGKGLDEYAIEFSVEARYLFQVWEIDVPLPCRRFKDTDDVSRLVEAFHRVHERVFAVRDDNSPIECLNWTGRLTVNLAHAARKRRPEKTDISPKPHCIRTAYFSENKAVDTPFYLGSDLAYGSTLCGPAIIVEPTTTIVVNSDATIRLTGAGNYVMEIRQ